MRAILARAAGASVIALGTAGVVVAAQANWQDVIRNLRHPDPSVRLASVQQLGRAGHVAAAEPVAALLVDPDDRVQAAAIDAELAFFLMEYGGGIRLLSFGGSKSRAQEAFEAGPLLRAAPHAPPAVLDRLIAAIRDENARIRFDAVHALGAIAEGPLPPGQAKALSDELDHYDPVVRAATARVLARVRAKSASPRLIEALTDSSAVVRQFAIEALGLLRDERAARALLDLLANGRGDVPAQALLALARIGPPLSRDEFRQRLSHRDAAMRRAAAEGLGRLQDRESLETLQQLQETDRAEEVRLAAAFAVGQLGDPQTHVLAAHLILRDAGAQARDYLLEIGRPALAGIRATLEVAKDDRHRADLVHLVGFIGAPEDVPIVEAFVADRDERVRRAAADAIARLRR